MSTQLNLDVADTLYHQFANEPSLLYRVYNKSTYIPTVVDTTRAPYDEPISIEFLAKDIRTEIGSVTVPSTTSVSTVDSPIKFNLYYGVDSFQSIARPQYYEALTLTVIESQVFKTRADIVVGASTTVITASGTQQIEQLQQLNIVQNSQPLSYKVLRKLEDSGENPGENPVDPTDKTIPVEFNVSHNAYVGVSSPLTGAFDTVADNLANEDPVEYTDGDLLKVDHTTTAYKLITGKNDIKLSVQFNPTYVISKVDKG